ncbi:MAG: hypothetical protein WB495_24510, partial [Xanthobacteraceae bacterium]
MHTSIVPSSGAKSSPHVVVIGNQKGGSGKSTVCQSAFKFNPVLECARDGGQFASWELTDAAGLSEDESHGQA